MPLVLILLAAVGSGLLTVGVAGVLYTNSKKVVAADQWVAHTQEVLTNLQRATLFTERVESTATIYDLTKDEDQLDAARLNLVRLNSAVQRLRNLVSDNINQSSNLAQLDVCTGALTTELKRVPLNKARMRDESMRCHQALQMMNEQETQLLEQRNQDSRRKSQYQTISEIATGACSLLIFGILFGLLYRDARMRVRIARETTRTNLELAATVSVMESRALEAKLLAAARHELQLCTAAEQVYSSAALRLSQLLPGTAGAFGVLNSSRNYVENVATWSTEAHTPSTLDVFDPESCCGLRAGQLRWRRPGVSELDCQHFASSSPTRYVCVPLVAHGETLGMLCIECVSDEAAALVEHRVESLQQFVQLTAMSIAALRLRTKLENQSIRDPLTGLFNRHFMQIAFDRELARALRRKSTAAVFMLDVDHFKKFNDEYGHAAGDAALKQVSETFRSQVRTDDIACRYGGEEFAIILPEISAQDAYEKAEKLRAAVEGIKIQVDRERLASVTLSIGVAMYPQEGETSELLLRSADKALYQAKHNGRNRVVLSDSNDHLAHA